MYYIIITVFYYNTYDSSLSVLIMVNWYHAFTCDAICGKRRLCQMESIYTCAVLSMTEGKILKHAHLVYIWYRNISQSRTVFVVRFLLGNSPASELYMPTYQNTLSVPSSTPTRLWRWNRQSVPKRRRIQFRRRGITQKKAHNIQNTAKAWNQE